MVSATVELHIVLDALRYEREKTSLNAASLYNDKLILYSLTACAVRGS